MLALWEDLGVWRKGNYLTECLALPGYSILLVSLHPGGHPPGESAPEGPNSLMGSGGSDKVG